MNAPTLDSTIPAAPESKPARVRRPFPWVRKVSVAEIAWEPEAVELFYQRNGANVRAGESFAIVRGDHDFPLGIASDHYRITSHTATRTAVMSFCADLVTPNGIVMSGHGYQVAHGYIVKNPNTRGVIADGAGGEIAIESKIVVINDHTGKGALRASLVSYAGGEAVGSVIRDRALHVGDQPDAWHSRIEAMVETAMLVQGAISDLLKAAAAHKLSDLDRETLRSRGIIVKDSAISALDALREWHAGYTKKISWGVWERRMGDDGILAMCFLLGRARYGAPIDAIVGGHRYGGRLPVAAAELGAEATAAG